MNLRILYVAYPLLAISDASCGGAEQVLLTLERELSRRGVRTTVAAAEGSHVTGELYATGKVANANTGSLTNPTLAQNASVVQPSDVDAFATRDEEHNEAILRLLGEERFDLVHDMSGTFWRCAGDLRVPVLATLHLPPALYARGTFDSLPLNLYFNCVSRSQLQTFKHLPQMLSVVENGIDLSRFDRLDSGISHPCKKRKGGAAISTETSNHHNTTSAPPESGREFLLWMGRICEEKAPHLAIDVATQAGLPIVVAGQVYPFSYHQQYFEREVQPRLRRYPSAEFVQSPTFEGKLALLDRARALLITSQIDETSSLVAMEAMARGTPVVAFRRGALGEVVADGVTGFIVDTQQEMAEAVNDLSRIDSAACRSRVKRLYSSTRMADDYLRLYDRVLRSFSRFRQSAA